MYTIDYQPDSFVHRKLILVLWRFPQEIQRCSLINASMLSSVCWFSEIWIQILNLNKKQSCSTQCNVKAYFYFSSFGLVSASRCLNPTCLGLFTHSSLSFFCASSRSWHSVVSLVFTCLTLMSALTRLTNESNSLLTQTSFGLKGS